MMKTIINTTLIVLCLMNSLSGQELDKLGGAALKVGGNIAIGGSFYEAIDQEPRQSPYSYFISANPVFSIYGFDIPLSFSYRDQEGNLSNPFQRFRISPSYKWVHLHAGDVNLQLSPYTLSGQIIKGGGLELSPGKFRFTAIYGSIPNPLAQTDTLVQGAILLETFDRQAMALKLGYAGTNYKVNLTGFRAKDDADIGSNSNIDLSLLKPEENIVLGLDFDISPFSFVRFHANAAGSALTSNQGSIDV